MARTAGTLTARLAIALCLTPLRLGAQAADPRAVQPERPTVATHAGTVSPGYLEVETGVEIDRIGGGNAAATPTLFKLGLGRRTQLGVGVTTVRAPAGSLGLGDVSLGLKWRLTEDVPLLGDFAVEPALKLPTGSVPAGRGTGTTDASVLAISSHRLGPVALDINAGYTRRNGDGSVAPRTATLWTISFGGPLAGRAGWVAELFGYPGTSGPAGAAPTAAVLAGPTLLVRRWLAVDAGFIAPVRGGQARAVYAGGVVNAGRI